MTPDEIAYLRAQAQAKGYNADDLLRAIQYESSGRPDIWGGKGKDYFGLIQLGPNERKQFGVDTAHPNARNQIDAAFNFLAARGFKPGMGMLDLYSTINAGSPGHYNASDRPGATVASHVAKMAGMPIPGGQPQPQSGGAMSYASPEQPAPTSITDLLASLPTDAGGKKPVAGLLAPQQPADLEQQDAYVRALADFHNRQHQASIAGLLGGN